MIQIQCPSCGKKLQAPNKLAAQVGRCPSCDKRFSIGAASEPVISQPPSILAPSSDGLPVAQASMTPLYQKSWIYIIALSTTVGVFCVVSVIAILFARNSAPSNPTSNAAKAVPTLQAKPLTAADVEAIVHRVLDEREAAQQEKDDEIATRFDEMREVQRKAAEAEDVKAAEQERQRARNVLSGAELARLDRIRARMKERGLNLATRDLDLILRDAQPLMIDDIEAALAETDTNFGKLCQRLRLTPRERVAFAIRLGGSDCNSYWGRLRWLEEGRPLPKSTRDDPSFVHLLDEYKPKYEQVNGVWKPKKDVSK
jgi:hypothetical protein